MTVEGTGSLAASSNVCGAGIGGGEYRSCGNKSSMAGLSQFQEVLTLLVSAQEDKAAAKGAE